MYLDLFPRKLVTSVNEIGFIDLVTFISGTILAIQVQFNLYI